MQLLLDEARYCRVALEARQRGVSMAVVIRDAIDRLPVGGDEVRRAAVAAILAAEPMDLPSDPIDLRQELDEARGRDVP